MGRARPRPPIPRPQQAPQATLARRYNPDSVNNAGSSNQGGPSAPKPKRQRTDQETRLTTQKKQSRGRLSGLMKMPMDIFTEVASHLMPEDIIMLSRSNKFFRNLLMRRSAVHIWHGAMRNVPKLPPCPPDMCEPQYLALIFLATCSMCGKSGPKRMNEILRVRLCDSCCNERLMPTGSLPTDIQILVPQATVTTSRRRFDSYSALRSDVAAVLVKSEELKQSGNNVALVQWKKKRMAELETRNKQASVLKSFLNYLEIEESRRQDRLRTERRTEIERRFVLLGWDKQDLQIGRYSHPREMDQLINQPVAITEQIWAEIKPKLIPILRANRTARLAAEKAERKSARKRKLQQIIGEIRDAEPALIDMPILIPNAPAARITHRRVFPLIVDLLEYPLIKSLDETDIPSSEMEARFEEHREEIEAHVLEWRTMVEGHLAELIREGRRADGLKKAAPAPKLPVGKSKPNPLNGLSDDLKLLLRADSLFESGLDYIHRPVTYDYLVNKSQIHDLAMYRLTPLDLAPFKRHEEAQEVARYLLVGLGKTNASFLELDALGQRFKCGSCESKHVHSWERIVQHYVDERREWEEYQAHLEEAQEQGVVFQNLHALDDKPKKSLVKLLDSVQRDSVYDYSGPANLKCLLCVKVGVEAQTLSKDEVVEHVINWHGVEEPKLEEHYDKFFPDYSDEMDEDEDDSQWSGESRWCYECEAYHSEDDW